MVQEFNHHREWVAALDKYEKRLIENPDLRWEGQPRDQHKIGRASCRERV